MGQAFWFWARPDSLAPPRHGVAAIDSVAGSGLVRATCKKVVKSGYLFVLQGPLPASTSVLPYDWSLWARVGIQVSDCF